MTPEFKRALAKVKRVEGGFVDNPHDRGGATNLGITFKNFAVWHYERTGKVATIEDLKALTAEQAQQFYFDGFWKKGKMFNRNTDIQPIADWWEPMGEFMFDSMVNHRPDVPGRLLQRALNVINRDEKAWPDLMEDGYVGPATLEVLKKVPNLPRGRERLMVAVVAYRMRYMIDIAEADKTQEEFIAGWLFRVAEYIRSI